MFRKNDPLVDSVKQVMDENCVRREVEKFVNEEFGVTSRRGLPHELHAQYDAVLAEATEIALKEGLSQLQESFKEKLKAAGKFITKNTNLPKVGKRDKYVAAQNMPGNGPDQQARRIAHVKSLEESEAPSRINESFKQFIRSKFRKD